MDPESTLLQNQINILLEQVNQANHALVFATHTLGNLNTTGDSVKTGKTETFTGKNARSWLKSLEHFFETQPK